MPAPKPAAIQSARRACVCLFVPLIFTSMCADAAALTDVGVSVRTYPKNRHHHSRTRAVRNVLIYEQSMRTCAAAINSHLCQPIDACVKFRRAMGWRGKSYSLTARDMHLAASLFTSDRKMKSHDILFLILIGSNRIRDVGGAPRGAANNGHMLMEGKRVSNTQTQRQT